MIFGGHGYIFFTVRPLSWSCRTRQVSWSSPLLRTRARPLKAWRMEKRRSRI